MMHSAEKAVFTKTLLCFLQSLEDSVISVDLRNETCVTGKLTSVDSAMNLHMDEVEVKYPSGSQSAFPNTFIRGKNIRYVRFDDEVNVQSALKKQIAKYKDLGNYNERTTAGKSKPNKF